MTARQHTAVGEATVNASPLESPEIRVIVPARRRVRLSALRRDLPVVSVLASRDFKVKYKQSILGPLWLFFQPLALFAGFLIAFRGSGAIGPGIPYVVFALTGLMVWSFFQAAMTIGSASFITNYQLVRFTPCPRIAFPLAGMVASLPSFAVPTVGALVATVVAGVLSPRVVLLPLAFVWLFMLTAGFVALTASLAVRFRDIISLVPFMLSLGLFVSPVGYSLARLSTPVRALLDLNPLTGLLEASRWMTISHYSPSVPAVCISLATTLIMIIGGWRVFTRFETTMADDI
jgi:ABC-type polysaccharide/polyol phosphate export permease